MTEDSTGGKVYQTREQAYSDIDYMVDKAAIDDSDIYVRFLKTIDGERLADAVPEELKPRIAHTGTYANLKNDAYYIYVNSLLDILNPRDVKKLLKSLLDTQSWFTIKQGTIDIYYNED